NRGGHHIRVVVVDNASRPDEVKILRGLNAAQPVVHVIENANNVGYFAGLNMGLEAVGRLHPGIGWVVAGNNDLEFPEDFCDRVQQAQATFAAHAVISPDIVTLDGEHQNPHVISDISPVREIFYDLYYSNYYIGQAIYRLAKLFPKATRRGDEDQWQTARPIYQGHGSCYLLTPKFFERYGTLWAPTFMMAEEVFLSLQLKKGGEQVYYSPAVRVTHRWHGSLQSVPGRRRWDMARDAHREYRKHVKVFKSAAQ
ncbi:MAG: glycosyltransferase, partial [Pseudomonadota bacterium]